jgi:hypothetical protein
MTSASNTRANVFGPKMAWLANNIAPRWTSQAHRSTLLMQRRLELVKTVSLLVVVRRTRLPSNGYSAHFGNTHVPHPCF